MEINLLTFQVSMNVLDLQLQNFVQRGLFEVISSLLCLIDIKMKAQRMMLPISFQPPDGLGVCFSLKEEKIEIQSFHPESRAGK